MKRIVVYTTGALTGAASAIWLWWALQFSWWIGGLFTLFFASVTALWLGMQFEDQEQSAPLKKTAAGIWIFVGASWISLTVVVMIPLVCLLLIPSYRITDVRESKALAERVSHLFYLEGAAAIFNLFSLAGVRRWRPIGIIVRFVLAATGIGFGVYMIALLSFSLSFWR